MEKEDMLRQIEEFILSNGLSVVEEYKLWNMLGNRINGREKCLASVVDREIRNMRIMNIHLGNTGIFI